MTRGATLQTRSGPANKSRRQPTSRSCAQAMTSSSGFCAFCPKKASRASRAYLISPSRNLFICSDLWAPQQSSALTALEYASARQHRLNQRLVLGDGALALLYNPAKQIAINGGRLRYRLQVPVRQWPGFPVSLPFRWSATAMVPPQ